MPAHKGEFKVVVIWEDEIRTAAKALNAIGDVDDDAPEQVWKDRLKAAFDACWAALCHAIDDDASIVLGSKPLSFGKKSE